ncbi:MAG TPA: hypothetical protein VK864_08195 [Longimicrobiales bacterium]|nr:hypothetical protein [Longimicrobiales bacterium]
MTELATQPSYCNIRGHALQQGSDGAPVYQPGRLLFLVLYPTGNRLYVTELATGVVRILHFPTVPGSILDPSWSPLR